MADKKTEQLREQYEEAAFALLMEEYAQENGENLLEEFQAAQANGLTPNIPEGLDKKCRNAIRKHFTKKKRTAQIRRFLRTAGKSVAVLITVLGISSALLLSVDAIRRPVFQFFINLHGSYVTLGPDPTEAPELLDDGSILSGLLPDEYYLERHVTRLDDNFTVIYLSHENEDARVMLQSWSLSDNVAFDTEGAQIKKARIDGYEGFVIEKDGWRIVWEVPEANKRYSLKASHLSMDDVWFIARTLAGRCRNGDLIAG